MFDEGDPCAKSTGEGDGHWFCLLFADALVWRLTHKQRWQEVCRNDESQPKTELSSA